MNKAYLYRYLFLFLSIIVFISSCGWKEKSKLSENNQQINELNFLPDTESDPQIAEYIRHIFQDKNGGLWLGTNNYGIVHFDGDSLSYHSYDQGFDGGQITGITEDLEKNLWFATEKGIVKYDWSTNKDGTKKFTNYTDYEVFKGNHVWSIMSCSKGFVWVGTSVGVLRFDGDKFMPFELPYTEGKEASRFISKSTIWSIKEDSKGNLWFGTNGNGVFKYDRSEGLLTDTQRFTQFTKKDGLTDNSVDPIIEDSQGNMWFGTRNGGLSHYDPSISLSTSVKAFTNYTAPDSIGNNEVCIVYEDKKGNIWFSSEGYGVYRYNASVSPISGGASFTNFFTKQGLGVRAVQTIFEDKEGRLWVGGGGGLYRYDPIGGTGDGSFINVTKNGPWK